MRSSSLGAGCAAGPRIARRPRAGNGSRARPQQHRAAIAPRRGAARGVGVHAADHLGRAGLRGARRKLVQAGRSGRVAVGQRRRVRREATQPRPRSRPCALADEAGETVRVLWRREDVVRRGPKRPPLAIALRADGSGEVRVGTTPGSPDLNPLLDRVRSLAPELSVQAADVVGPVVAPELRGAGWAEVLAALSALGAAPGDEGAGRADVTVPGAGRAAVELRLGDGERGRVDVEVWAGEVSVPRDAAFLCLGRRPPGARTRLERGHCGRRRRRAGRPHHSLVRHPLGAATCLRSPSAYTRTTAGRSTGPMRCSLPRSPPHGSPKVGRRAGRHAAAAMRAPLPRRGSIGPSRGAA